MIKVYSTTCHAPAREMPFVWLSSVVNQIVFKSITAPYEKRHYINYRNLDVIFDFVWNCTPFHARSAAFVECSGITSLCILIIRTSRCGYGTLILCICNAFQISRFTSDKTPERPFSGSLIQNPISSSNPSAPNFVKVAVGAGSFNTRGTPAVAVCNRANTRTKTDRKTTLTC